MKNRKSVVALLLVAIIGIVGLTVAYFSNSTSIENEFETAEYGTDVTETFTSPTGWQPGDETPKVLTVKNTGEVDDGLKESARNMIDDAIFYLGGYDSNSLGATESIYTWERGINVYNKRNTVRPTKSLDKVGLMYASDVYMVYANGVDYGCYNNPKSCYWANAVLGWVYNSNVIEGESNQYSTWLISPDSSSSYAVFGVDNSGILTGYSANGSEAIRPVVYLSADVKIIDGDGSSSNPYKLK